MTVELAAQGLCSGSLFEPTVTTALIGGLKKLLHIPCGWQVWDHRTNSFIHTYIFRTVNAGVLADLPTKIFQMSDLNPKMFWGGHIPKPLNLLAQKCVAKIIKMSGIAYKMSGKSATCVTMSENE